MKTSLALYVLIDSSGHGDSEENIIRARRTKPRRPSFMEKLGYKQKKVLIKLYLDLKKYIERAKFIAKYNQKKSVLFSDLMYNPYSKDTDIIHLFIRDTCNFI